MDQPLRDRIVLLLISGMSTEAAESYCLKQRKDLGEARRLVADDQRVECDHWRGQPSMRCTKPADCSPCCRATPSVPTQKKKYRCDHCPMGNW